MAFDSLGAFLSMGEHGPYVWACYGVFFALSIVLIAWSKRQRKAAFRGLARRQSGSNEANTGTAAADFARVDSSRHVRTPTDIDGH